MTRQCNVERLGLSSIDGHRIDLHRIQRGKVEVWRAACSDSLFGDLRPPLITPLAKGVGSRTSEYVDRVRCTCWGCARVDVEVVHNDATFGSYVKHGACHTCQRPSTEIIAQQRVSFHARHKADRWPKCWLGGNRGDIRRFHSRCARWLE